MNWSMNMIFKIKGHFPALFKKSENYSGHKYMLNYRHDFGKILRKPTI